MMKHEAPTSASGDAGTEAEEGQEIPAQPFEHEIRVTWGDCDPANIVYTARIPWFALDAINAWWEHHTGHGWYQMELDLNIGTPFVSMQIDFRQPVTPRHRLVCQVWPNRLGKTSVGFHVSGLQEGVVCFEGNFVCVFSVASEFRKRQPPEEIRALLQRHLVEPPTGEVDGCGRARGLESGDK